MVLFFLRYAFERIYEYFLNKFPKSIASDDGMFFMPKSLVKMRTSYDRSNSDSVYRIDK
ncbi:N-6 DNA methylase [Oribacterium asaccharolyticum]|uniref:N-6 DNA methylase n=1 Tax=Oribacterium asaccharolyticum TaxID=1501332 RepID=UPI002FE53BB4